MRPANKNDRNLNIKINNEYLAEQENLCFLGILFDNKFDFKPQFKKIYAKVKKGFGALILAKNFLDFRCKTLIYHSLIHSHLSYGALIWLPNIRAKELKSLVTLQKKCIRILFNSKYNSHTGKLFQLSGITKVENIIKREAAILCYKLRNNELPKAVKDLFENYSNSSARQTRHTDHTVFEISNKSKPHRIMFKIMDAWNNLDVSIKSCSSLNLFRKKIRAEMNDFEECNKQQCRSCNFSTGKAIRAMRL